MWREERAAWDPRAARATPGGCASGGAADGTHALSLERPSGPEPSQARRSPLSQPGVGSRPCCIRNSALHEAELETFFENEPFFFFLAVEGMLSSYSISVISTLGKQLDGVNQTYTSIFLFYAYKIWPAFMQTFLR